MKKPKSKEHIKNMSLGWIKRRERLNPKNNKK